MYAFIHIEKTGGSTLTGILRRSFGTRHCDIRLPASKRPLNRADRRQCIDLIDLRRVQRLYRNLSGIAGHYVKPYNELGRLPMLRFFMFVRDPASRFRSHFLNRAKCHTEQAFHDWTSESWNHNWQTKMIAGEPNSAKAIDLIAERIGFVGLTERFDESLVMLEQWLGEPDFRGEYRPANQLHQKRRPHDLARQRTDLSYLQSDHVRARIAEFNAEDQKVYDFVTSTVFPQQVAAYQHDLPTKLQILQQRCRGAGLLMESLWSGFYRNFIYEPLVAAHAF
jgi:Sulfotransferase family